MSLLIKGMDMPKRKRVRTEKGHLMLWHIKNENVNKTELCGAAAFPCSLFFNMDGTVELSINGKKYPIVEVSKPHSRLLDDHKVLRAIIKAFPGRGMDFYDKLEKAIDGLPTIIEAEE